MHIRNFRCFEETVFELNYPGGTLPDGIDADSYLPNVNLFIGDNGSGKSSVFKAIPLGVLAPVLASSGLQADYFVHRNADVSKESPVDGARIVAHLAPAVLDLPDFAKNYVGTLIGICSVSLKGDYEEIQSLISSSPSTSSAASNPEWPICPNETSLDALLWDEIYLNRSPGFFLAGYGANRRVERPEGYSENSRTPRYLRVASLFEDHVGLVPFSYAHQRLAAVGSDSEAREMLNKLLPEELSLTDKQDGQARPLFGRGGLFLPFQTLSDGYRTFIASVWDLLYQLSMLQPSEPLSGIKGVVIVDEIDLLLHPEWQRTVIRQVASASPCLQFLFSSHSPLVAGSLYPQNIFVLDDNKVQRYHEDIHGKTASQVLTSSYFGLNSTRAPGTGTLVDAARREMSNGGGAKLADVPVTSETIERAKRIIAEIQAE